MPEQTTSPQEKRCFAAGTEIKVPDDNQHGLKITRKAQTFHNGKKQDEIWISTQLKETRGNGDIVVATGIRFDEYMSNPVVGWNHGQGKIDFPIANTIALETVAGTGMAAKFVWPPFEWDNPKESVAAVDDIHKLWDGHFINAASIWIRILKAEPQEGQEDSWWPALTIHESLLLEWALVYVPMNQGAVRRSLKQIAAAKYLDRANQRERLRLKRKDAQQSPTQGGVANIIVPIETPTAEVAWSDIMHDFTKQLSEQLPNGRQT